MNQWRPQHFKVAAQASGVSSAVIENSIATAKKLHSTNPALPPIFTLRHFAHEADVPYYFLRRVIARSSLVDPYRVFKLKKKKVGHAPDRFRYICVPHPLLLKAQRWIHENIASKLPVHECSGAYKKDSQIYEVAGIHVGSKWLIKLDVTNFFESILEGDVYRIFRSAGYQPLIAFELARLCTRLRDKGNPIRQELSQPYEIWQYRSHYLGHLPQGAPTSPMLANLAAFELDTALVAIAEEEGLKYTRYADDITLSTPDKGYSRGQCEKVIKRVYAAMRDNGLWPNRAKTQVISPRARKIVLGLCVETNAPRLTREFKENVRMHIHFLEHPNIGPVKHAAKRGFDSVLGLQHHIFGLVAFAIGIEPQWGAARRDQLKAVNWPTAAGP